MSTFAYSKFNADTDPDRPVIGTKLDYNGKVLLIKKVHWVLTSQLLIECVDNQIMDSGIYDECLIKEHTSRPAVQWLIWGDYEV